MIILTMIAVIMIEDTNGTICLVPGYDGHDDKYDNYTDKKCGDNNHGKVIFIMVDHSDSSIKNHHYHDTSRSINAISMPPMKAVDDICPLLHHHHHVIISSSSSS